MSVSVSMPQLGESVTEGTVTRWLKQEGERVEADEPLLEVSTDKVDTEIPSPVVGHPARHHGRRGRDGRRRRRARRHRRGRAPAAARRSRAQQAEQPAAQAAACPGRPHGQPGAGPAGDGAAGVQRVRVPAAVREQPTQQAAGPRRPRTAVHPAAAPAPRRRRCRRPACAADSHASSTRRCQAAEQQAPAAQAPPAPAPAGASVLRRQRRGPRRRSRRSRSRPPRRSRQLPRRPRRRPRPQPAGRGTRSAAPAEAPDGAGPDLGSGAEGPYVTPLVRKLAAEHGMDLGAVTGTGVGGRIRKQDVLDAARACATRRAAGRPQPSRHAGRSAPQAPSRAAPAQAPPAAPRRRHPPRRRRPPPARPPRRPARPAIVPSSLRGTHRAAVPGPPGDRPADGRVAADLGPAHHRGRGRRHRDRPAAGAGQGRRSRPGRASSCPSCRSSRWPRSRR